ncbi:MAG: GMC family oxidoreductase [bacterium]|nr:GMC family oxidoreductase [bacterium]
MLYKYKDIDRHVEIDCDVCVVGSGAGGAVASKELAEAGLNVVLVEEGGYFTTKDFKVDDTIWSTSNLYRDGGASIIMGKPSVMLSEGRCVGGSTTINGAMCWRTPGKVFKRWQWERGLYDITTNNMEPYFTKVEETIHAKSILPEAKNQDSELLRLGAEKLGYRYRANIRSQDHCVGANMCITGCPTGAKHSTLVNYIPAFLNHGGELFTNCRVHRVKTKRGKVTGVTGWFVDPQTKEKKYKLTVKSPIVIVSGGAVQTPALLKKSGIRDEKSLLGKNLLVHPNMKVVAAFEEAVNAWQGVNQGYQITEFQEEGLLMGVNFTSPGVLALAMPLEGNQMLRVLKKEFHHLVMGGALIEDTGSGTVYVGPFDTVVPTYQLNEHDFRQCIRGAALLTEVFFAAGAKKCYLPFTGMHEIRSPDDIPKIFQLKLKPAELELLTVHVMGTVPMGSQAHNSVLNSYGAFHNVKGLYVADASVFPTSIGVNPQVTIMALATRTAEYIANRST